MDSNEINHVAEMMLLVDELDYCNRHMERAYKNSRNPNLSDEERETFRDCMWEHLDESLDAFSYIREMPVIALLTCINILEHDQDGIEFPKNDEEHRMYEAADMMKSCLRRIIEERG